MAMKKTLLFLLAGAFAFSTLAQESAYKRVSADVPKIETLGDAPAGDQSVLTKTDRNETIKTTVNGRDVSFIQIGSTGNAYGFFGNPRTYLWADPMVNSVVFTHRMLGGTEVEGNSRIAYDLSTDGGTTWTNNVQVYTPLGPGEQYPMAAGRYPEGLVINPNGNTDPDDAFYAYLIPTIINENGIWGGYAWGSNALTQTDPSNPTQTNVNSGDDTWRLIPNALTVTRDAVMWYADQSTSSDGNFTYSGYYIIGRCEVDEQDSLVCEEELIPVLDEVDGINDTKIAFAADGQTGFICIMTDAVSDPAPYTNYHPVILKTEDGGETWSDPMHVQLGGEDGIESLKNYFSDEAILAANYPEGFDRDEVYYNMGYHVDMMVDQDGNPYITGLIAIGDEEGWYPNETQMATWNVYSEDGGETWNADALYDNIWLQGDIGAIAQYNRPQISSTWDGHYLFFSWLDSEIDVATQNDRPNIYVIGYDVQDNTYSEIVNVTYFSQAWNQAFFGCQSYYVFAEQNGDMWDCEIPFVYEEFTVPGDDLSPCNFWYIDGFTLSMPVGTPEIPDERTEFKVQQNFPNPASYSTQILVNADTDLPVELAVSNLLGQEVFRASRESNALVHAFELDVSQFTPGIYLYTVKIGAKTVTKKMMVE